MWQKLDETLVSQSTTAKMKSLQGGQVRKALKRQQQLCGMV
eukprot:CAMPEP_0172791836 /NCGR_PEP_ID=MMETSP1074-20121228/208670_1 /TAXON_ID=2916 /ORGANISM="Ceratium fusus, Strain PA161109" /LENGTH=40 /DNA_ID= /DNA_START= /DNA_END= /DNA_ORIENTATION=